jgi:peroxiredoxin Q/BCP
VRRTRHSWGLAAVLLAVVAPACGGVRAAAPRTLPLWERPGMAGAVRPEMGRPQPGDVAPDFELPVAGGGAVRLGDLRGSWVVLHFTASWCPFCDAEVEHLGELAVAYAPRGVRVLLIDVKEDVPHFIAYAKERVPPAVTALYDTVGETAARYAPPHAQPSFADRAQVMFDTTLIVDPEGIIRLFLFPDSAHFDPTFRGVRRELDQLVSERDVPVAVTVEAPLSMIPQSDAALVVSLAIRPGYHVMSDRPSRSNYVATEVRVAAPEGLAVGSTSYPPPVPFALGEQAIATFEGVTPVRVLLHAHEGAAPGERILRGEVRYQACTRGRCLTPAMLPFETRVRIDRPGAR